MKKFDQEYWESRYKEQSTGWDIGFPSPPLQTFIDGLPDKNIAILIPGAGYGHEAIYLFEQGFTHVTVVDLSPSALLRISEKYPNFPEKQLILGDFFEHKGSYDLILEQTFFCALSPELREKYVLKMRELLKSKGILAGVLFDFPKTNDGPPFGGNPEEYRSLFEEYFAIKILESCYNSVKPRQGKEVFFIFENETFPLK
ncbi:MAG: methyltransferase [Leeuwenhoekiella sp.]